MCKIPFEFYKWPVTFTGSDENNLYIFRYGKAGRVWRIKYIVWPVPHLVKMSNFFSQTFFLNELSRHTEKDKLFA